MKRFISFFAVLAVLTVACMPFGVLFASAANETSEIRVMWNNTAVSGFYRGSGTGSDPYVIDNAAQLAWLAAVVESGDSCFGEYFALNTDISLNNTSSSQWYLTAKRWTPIGTEETPFRGTFLGNGHVVRGISITDEKNYQGLFGNIKDATIQDVGVEEAYIKGESHIGALVGHVSESSYIYRCYSREVSVNGNDYVGGLVGFSKGHIYDCYYADGIVNGTNYAGGIAGGCAGGSVNRCYAVALDTVKASDGNAGSVCGYDYSTDFNDCYYATNGNYENLGTGLGIGAMSDGDEYKGFDFDTVWTMEGNPDYDYPELKVFVGEEAEESGIAAGHLVLLCAGFVLLVVITIVRFKNA